MKIKKYNFLYNFFSQRKAKKQKVRIAKIKLKLSSSNKKQLNQICTLFSIEITKNYKDSTNEGKIDFILNNCDLNELYSFHFNKERQPLILILLTWLERMFYKATLV